MAKFSCGLCDGTGFVSKEKKEEYEKLKAGNLQSVVIATPTSSEPSNNNDLLMSELDNIRNHNNELITQNELLENKFSEVLTQNRSLQTELCLEQEKNKSNELVFATIKEGNEKALKDVKRLKEELLIWEVDKGLKKKNTTSFSWFKKH